jgi:hypothetical protein
MSSTQHIDYEYVHHDNEDREDDVFCMQQVQDDQDNQDNEDDNQGDNQDNTTKEVPESWDDDVPYENSRDREYREMMEQLALEKEDQERKDEMDAWWEANKENLKPKPKATEKEMIQEYEHFQTLLIQDRIAEATRTAEMISFKEKTIGEWYNSHPATKINQDSSLDDQWVQYNVEYFQEKQQQDQAAAITASKLCDQKLALISKKQGKKAKARHVEKTTRPNAQGKLQGKQKKDKERKKKEKEMATQKTMKIAGQQSEYVGKRAAHRAKVLKASTEIKIVPREQLVAQISLNETEEEEQNEEVQEKVEEVQEKVEEVQEKVEEVQVEKVEQVEEEVEEQVEDEDFAFFLLSAQGKQVTPTPLSSPCKSTTSTSSKRSRKGQVLNIEVGTSLISQKRDERASTDSKFASRMGGFDMLSNTSTLQNKLTCTTMCKSVSEKTVCPHGDKCRFAHSFDQLQKRQCAFGQGCRLVKKTKDGYVNKPSARTGKTCCAWHPDETNENYSIRLNLGVTVGITSQATAPSTPEPIRLNLKSDKPTYTAPAAPWAPKKSRWGPATTPVVQPVPTKMTRWSAPVPASAPAPVPASAPAPAPASVPASVPAAHVTVIRCTMDKFQAITSMIGGRQGFRIEIIS